MMRRGERGGERCGEAEGLQDTRRGGLPPPEAPEVALLAVLPSLKALLLARRRSPPQSVPGRGAGWI